MVILQLLLTFVPFMQAAFSTESISLVGWLIAIGAGIIVLLVTELDKYFRKNKANN